MNQQSPQAVDAPAKSGLAKGVPVVNRIAPELSLSAEIVGRYSGYEARPVFVIEQKQFRVGPYITRIRRNKEWQVADQAHAFRVRIVLQVFCLAEQQKLRKSNLIDQAACVLAPLGQSGWCSLDQVGWPFQIKGVVVLGLQRSKESVIFEPVCLVMAELLVLRPQIFARASSELCPGLVE